LARPSSRRLPAADFAWPQPTAVRPPAGF
jgi:hypothetical protein